MPACRHSCFIMNKFENVWGWGVCGKVPVQWGPRRNSDNCETTFPMQPSRSLLLLNLVVNCVIFLIWSKWLFTDHWRIQGVPGTCPSRSNFFHFQFLEKIFSNNWFLPKIQGLPPPSGKSWIRHCWDAVNFKFRSIKANLKLKVLPKNSREDSSQIVIHSRFLPSQTLEDLTYTFEKSRRKCRRTLSLRLLRFLYSVLRIFLLPE